MARVTGLRPVKAGIVEIAKSAGVRSLLAGQGAAAAARCCGMYRENHVQREHGWEPYGAPYAHEPVTLSDTAAERVYVASRAGGLDNARRNTLRKGCGI